MSSPQYFSFIEQTLHYFHRPHDSLPLAPLDNPAGWRGDQLGPLEDLAWRLSDAEQEEVLAAVRSATALGKPTRDLLAEDFPLPSLAEKISAWREQLRSGCGFVVVRGVPVASMSRDEAELFFWCFGLQLGRPGEQNPDGHLLGHVTDTGAAATDSAARLYKTAANIAYHCDAADVVGLLCLNKAKSGGESRIVSSVSVFNALMEREPVLAQRLFEPVLLDIRDREVDSEGSTLPIPPCRYDGHALRTFYHADYFRSVVRHAEVGELGETEQRLFDCYEAIANEPGMYFDMDLEPGDIQLLSNHSCLHARTEYEDYPEPERRRHLLRLWLSLPSGD